MEESENGSLFQVLDPEENLPRDVSESMTLLSDAPDLSREGSLNSDQYDTFQDSRLSVRSRVVEEGEMLIDEVPFEDSRSPADIAFPSMLPHPQVQGDEPAPPVLPPPPCSWHWVPCIDSDPCCPWLCILPIGLILFVVIPIGILVSFTFFCATGAFASGVFYEGVSPFCYFFWRSVSLTRGPTPVAAGESNHSSEFDVFSRTTKFSAFQVPDADYNQYCSCESDAASSTSPIYLLDSYDLNMALLGSESFLISSFVSDVEFKLILRKKDALLHSSFSFPSSSNFSLVYQQDSLQCSLVGPYCYGMSGLRPAPDASSAVAISPSIACQKESLDCDEIVLFRRHGWERFFISSDASFPWFFSNVTFSLDLALDAELLRSTLNHSYARVERSLKTNPLIIRGLGIVAVVASILFLTLGLLGCIIQNCVRCRLVKSTQFAAFNFQGAVLFSSILFALFLDPLYYFFAYDVSVSEAPPSYAAIVYGEYHSFMITFLPAFFFWLALVMSSNLLCLDRKKSSCVSVIGVCFLCAIPSMFIFFVHYFRALGFEENLFGGTSNFDVMAFQWIPSLSAVTILLVLLPLPCIMIWFAAKTKGDCCDCQPQNQNGNDCRRFCLVFFSPPVSFFYVCVVTMSDRGMDNVVVSGLLSFWLSIIMLFLLIMFLPCPVSVKDGEDSEKEEEDEVPTITPDVEHHVAPLQRLYVPPDVPFSPLVDGVSLIDPRLITISNEVIGRGAFGTVKGGVLRVGMLNVDVAIKKGMISSPEDARLAIRECRTMGEVQYHRNVLKCYGCYFEGSDVFCIVLERANCDLLYWLRRHPRLSPVERIGIVAQIAAGIIHLHSLNIVHSDLKPENILLANDDVIKLCDFGLSKHETSLATLREAGSVGYMPPPLTTPGSDKKKIDTYAFGVIAWEVLSGRRAYELERSRHTQMGLVSLIHRDGLRPNIQALEEFPQALALFVESCWEELPRNRPALDERAADLIEEARIEMEARQRTYSFQAFRSVSTRSRGNDQFARRGRRREIEQEEDEGFVVPDAAVSIVVESIVQEEEERGGDETVAHSFRDGGEEDAESSMRGAPSESQFTESGQLNEL